MPFDFPFPCLDLFSHSLFVFLAFTSFNVEHICLVPVIGLILGIVGNSTSWSLTAENKYNEKTRIKDTGIVESKQGVVAADDGRCSEIGASMLRKGGHAVDAAVATALCLGIVNAMASGIGGGSFMIVRSSTTSKAEAFDMRETAPLAASQVPIFLLLLNH